MAAGNTYTPIATTTLGSNTASYTFSSIPGTYTDLVLVYSGTGDNGDLYLQFNGDTATNYSVVGFYGNGGSATTGASRASNSSTSYVPGVVRAGVKTVSTTNIMNYANTTTYKTFLGRAGSSDYENQARAATWRSTDAITSIVIKNTGGNLNSGSIISLYGITAA
jgi:hypothetical protein